MSRTRGGPQKLKRWLKRKIEVEAPDEAAALHAKIHMQVGDGLIADTPVGNPDLWKYPPPKGYSGGRAKGNWQSRRNTTALGEIERADPEGEAPRREGQETAAQIQPGDFTTWANNVPYIRRLNGRPQWSKQQTPHWVERNITRVRAQFQ